MNSALPPAAIAPVASPLPAPLPNSKAAGKSASKSASKAAKASKTVPCQPVVIAHISDIHTGPESKNIALVNQMIDEINSNPEIDAVVITGDWAGSATPEEFKLARSFYDRFTKPKLTVPGNHEMQWGFDGGRRYAETFGATPYMMKVGKVLFFGLNTSPAFQFISAHIRSAELDFMKQQLAQNKDAALVVVAGHYSPNPNELSNWFDLPRALREAGVKNAIMLSGHIHRFHAMRWSEYPGITGRALMQNKGTQSPPGYLLIRVSADGKVAVSEKSIGKAEMAPKYTFKLGNHKTFKAPPSPRDYRDKRFAGKTPAYISRKIELNCTTTSGVAVDGNLLIAAGDDRSLRAYDLNSKENKTIWQIRTSGIIHGALTAGNGVVAAGMDDDRIAGFSTANGKELWSVKANCPVLSPGVLEDGIYYTGLGKDEFAAIEMSSGKILWRVPCGKGAFQAAPAVGRELIVTTCWDGSAYALNRKDGRMLWKWDATRKRERSAPGNSRPIIAGNRVVLSSFDGGSVVDATTGKIVFGFKGRESLGYSPEHQTAFTRTGKGLLAFDVTANAFKKRFETPDKHLGYLPFPMLIVNGKLWAGTNNGRLLIIDPANGKVEKVITCGFSATVGILPVGDKVWLTFNEGTVMQLPDSL